MPDVTIQPVKVSKLDPSEIGEGVHEADLKGRLDNPNARPAEDAVKPKDAKPADDKAKDKDKDAKAPDAAPDAINVADLAVNDYELYEALNLLKGLSITRGN